MKTVMIVDDAALIRRLVVDALGREGYRVLEAENGVQALSKLMLSGDAPELLLVDLEMPEMNGWALLVALKTHPRLAQLKVIILTGRDDTRAPYPTLRKPFTLGELATAVNLEVARA